MLIKEVCKIAKVTKKAVEYYEGQGLISPRVLDNGYRDFTNEDIEKLKRISVLRKLGISTYDIKIALSDNIQYLQKVSLKNELKLEREKLKQGLIDKLSRDNNWEDVIRELEAIEQNETITEKVLDAFPGYYGRFVSLHFARFFNEAISTEEQKLAYEEIVEFLDNVPSLGFSEDLQEFLIENTKHITTQNIREITESTKNSIENPEKFLSENKEMLEAYLAYKQSDEYKNSPVFKIQTILKEFNSTSGYNDVFIPAMKRLSRSYADYYKQLEIANEKLLAQYPEIEVLEK